MRPWILGSFGFERLDRQHGQSRMAAFPETIFSGSPDVVRFDRLSQAM